MPSTIYKCRTTHTCEQSHRCNCFQAALWWLSHWTHPVSYHDKKNISLRQQLFSFHPLPPFFILHLSIHPLLSQWCTKPGKIGQIPPLSRAGRRERDGGRDRGGRGLSAEHPSRFICPFSSFIYLNPANQLAVSYCLLHSDIHVCVCVLWCISLSENIP